MFEGCTGSRSCTRQICNIAQGTIRFGGFRCVGHELGLWLCSSAFPFVLLAIEKRSEKLFASSIVGRHGCLGGS